MHFSQVRKFLKPTSESDKEQGSARTKVTENKAYSNKAGSSVPLYLQRSSDGSQARKTQQKDPLFTRPSSRLQCRVGTYALPNLIRPKGNTLKSRLSRHACFSRPKKFKEQFPWIGQVRGAWSVALRKTPKKDPKNPHGNTLADLPIGTFITVKNRSGGWLKAQATVGGKEFEGYVWKKYVMFNRYDFDPMTLRDAMVELKKAETAKKAEPRWQPNEAQFDKICQAIEFIDETKKYYFDEASYRVSFDEKSLADVFIDIFRESSRWKDSFYRYLQSFPASSSKIKISTIEDFILFVEAVEQQYPDAGPKEVVSEIRQIWFADQNWKLLVASQGIKQKDKHVNIETAPNPIAERFDMKDLAPKSGKVFSTAMGDVDIGHVMAGIDARLSGFPMSYPADFMKAQGRDRGKAKFKYRSLKEYSGADPTTFTTFAGDLGQAYAIYIYDLYDKKDKSAKFWQYLQAFAKPAELLGDLHGYIAVEVAKEMRDTGKSSTGKAIKASTILRDMYLVNKGESGKPYLYYLEKVSGKQGKALKNKIVYDSLMFAHLWYGKLVSGDMLEIWTPGDLFDDYLRDFAEKSDRHERNADPSDTLSGAVDQFLELTKKSLR